MVADNLPEQFATAVDIVGVWRIRLQISPFGSRKNAICAQVNQAGIPGPTEIGQAMWEKAVDRDGCERVLGLIKLLHETNAINHVPRLNFLEQIQ